MFTQNPEEFTSYVDRMRSTVIHDHPLTMNRALLVDTAGFRISSESATDNQYMASNAVINPALARMQHAAVCAKIKECRVPVACFPGVLGQDDGMYPNNVFATIPGKLIIGRMHHHVRRLEASRADIRNYFSNHLGYQICDLSQQPEAAELTGTMIINHHMNVGFCGLTRRASLAGAQLMHEAFGLNATLAFPLGPDEYHTNLILTLLAGRACIFHPEGVQDEAVRAAIRNAYGQQCIEITKEEKNAFVGNCLAITPSDILFSQTSVNSMRLETYKKIADSGFHVHSVDISELELGGGSLRCLIAEIF